MDYCYGCTGVELKAENHKSLKVYSDMHVGSLKSMVIKGMIYNIRNRRCFFIISMVSLIYLPSA